jgi:hypothetical protein
MPRLLPAVGLDVRHRHLIVEFRPLPAAPLAECRKYLVEVPRPMPAAPRRFLIAVPRP